MSQHDVPERLTNREKGFAEDGGNQTMEVLVETLTGTAFEMTVSPSDTVLAIKSKIYRVEGIPVSQQHLLHKLVELEDTQSLWGCGVRGGSRLRLVLGLRGGPSGTRQLAQPYRHREEEWVGCLTGCRVAVVILRDGERVRVLRVGAGVSPTAPTEADTASPARARARSPRTRPRPRHAVDPQVTAQDALTMTKMAALRRRLEDLSLRRRPNIHRGGGADIPKTRSEETLTPRARVTDTLDGIDPLEDSDFDTDSAYNYRRLRASFADSYSMLPPLSGRAQSSQWLPGSISELYADGQEGAGTLLEEDGFDDHAGGLLTPPWWRSASSLQQDLSPNTLLSPHTALNPHSSRLDGIPADRMLPSLSRHRNRDLHLSDDGLHMPVAMETALPPVAMETALPRVAMDTAPNRRQRLDRIRDMDRALRAMHQEHQIAMSPEPMKDPDSMVTESRVRLPPLGESVGAMAAGANGDGAKTAGTEKKRRLRCLWCRRRVTIATVHRCRCGAALCAPHRYPEAHLCTYHYSKDADDTRSLPLPRI